MAFVASFKNPLEIKMRQKLPFSLLGIDSDNGSEFINKYSGILPGPKTQLYTLTTIPQKRQLFCGAKNYSIVRRAVGYARYDTEAQLHLLNELYATLRLYTTFLQPTMKLKSKERVGGK